VNEINIVNGTENRERKKSAWTKSGRERGRERNRFV